MELFLVLNPPFDLVGFLNIEFVRHKVHDGFTFNAVQLLLEGDELQFWKKNICGKVRGNFEIVLWGCFVAAVFYVFSKVTQLVIIRQIRPIAHRSHVSKILDN